jgi:DNA (cytosine-5)-methyltransferase 1
VQGGDEVRYASVCDGIGAAHVAWQPLGWECAWTSEIEPFPSAVVEHHYGFKNLGDMTKITKEMLDEQGPVDLLVGGTPCQSFSVAGLRGGLADPRGNLALRFVQLAAVMQPRWVVWENVPGVLSSGKGRDFGAFLGALGELGYGFAYRVLDAQWFGVAQRRRRVFVVAHLGDWRRPAAVLFERESVFGNPQSRGTQGEETSFAVEAGSAMHGGVPFSKAKRAQSNEDDETWKHGEVDPTQNHFDVGDTRATTVVVESIGFNWQNGGGYGDANDGLGITSEGVGPVSRSQVAAVAIASESSRRQWEFCESCGNDWCNIHECHTHDQHCHCRHLLDRDDDPAEKSLGRSVIARRLTPKESERLQGFPDNYTAVTFRKKPAADGPRYRALGNSMAVPCMAWLGYRIHMATHRDTE